MPVSFILIFNAGFIFLLYSTITNVAHRQKFQEGYEQYCSQSNGVGQRLKRVFAIEIEKGEKCGGNAEGRPVRSSPVSRT